MKDLKTIAFLLLASSVCTLVLGSAHLAYERAASLFSVRLYGVILDLAGVPAPADRIEETFLEHFDVRRSGDATYYIRNGSAAAAPAAGTGAGDSAGWQPGTAVFVVDGPGLWSVIEVLLAVSPDRQTLSGMRILSQAETPGLGGRIAETAFQDAFRGTDLRPSLRIVKFAMAPNEVDAISGATRTCTALQAIINSGIRAMDQALGEAH